MLCAQVPGKLILSGEHAVVYGMPAVAVAVDRYTWVSVQQQQCALVNFTLFNLNYATKSTFAALKKMAKNLSYMDMLKKPFALVQYAVHSFLDQLAINMPPGLKIEVNSRIPLGCGMGSSASVIVGILWSLVHFFKIELDFKKILHWALEIEHLQHGRSSGLDLNLSLYGGGVYYKDGQIQERFMPEASLAIVNTGKPLASTGECVMAVRQRITPYLAEFSAVTEAMYRACKQCSVEDLRAAIRLNHQLLCQLGVVPSKVARFIQDIEAIGGAAKISGAGSIVGEQAGIVLISSTADIHALAKQYGYSVEYLNFEQTGVRLL
jgi:mevalonate kinase